MHQRAISAIRGGAEFPAFARGYKVLDIPYRRLHLWQVKCLGRLQRPAVCFQLQPDRRTASKRSNGTSLIGWTIEVRCCAFRRSHFDGLLPNASSAHLCRVGDSRPSLIRKCRRSRNHAESSNSLNWSFLLYAGSLSRAPSISLAVWCVYTGVPFT